MSTTFSADAFTDHPAEFVAEVVETVERAGHFIVAGPVLTKVDTRDGRSLYNVSLELEQGGRP